MNPDGTREHTGSERMHGMEIQAWIYNPLYSYELWNIRMELWLKDEEKKALKMNSLSNFTVFVKESEIKN